MNNKLTLTNQLSALGLSTEESTIYLELLQEQRTHLELARKTGINRTKVYRIAEDLENRSLITRQTDDCGTFLVATDPTTLEVQLANKEEKIKAQREIFSNLLPQLTQLQKSSGQVPGFFEINTYEGVDGMKQMLWHELKAKDEVLIFGSGTIDSVVNGNKRFAERHRAMTVAAGYRVREIINPNEKDEGFTSLQEFKDIFSKKEISRSSLCLEQQIVIYNNTVAVYHWRNDEKVGYEVTNEAYATMWRQLFEHYWSQL